MVKGVFMSEQQNMKVSGLAVASMILGIIALVCSCCLYYVSIPCSILGIVFAAVALKEKDGINYQFPNLFFLYLIGGYQKEKIN